jgi:hypothetical protein
MGYIAALVAAVLITPAAFLQAHDSNGAFSESGGTADAALTSWAVLGLSAAGAQAPGSLAYLQAQEGTLTSASDVALVALAEEALGAKPVTLRARLVPKPSGEIGPTLNSTYWAVLALGHASKQTTRFLLVHQAKSGGFSWYPGGQPDSNDTAAALEALSVAGVHGTAVTRAVGFLLTFETPNGGFELTHGRGPDAQSTAWAVQGLIAAGRTPSRRAFSYLATLRQADGSYRYSSRYATTPVWVTSQVLAALARKSFPLIGTN